MSTKCANCPLRNLSIFVPMSPDEVKFMESFKSGEMRVEAGTTLMLEGSNSPQLYTALDGMGLRYKSLESGDRQVINFVLPGDFIGLQAGVMRSMQHSVEASTPMTLCVFDRRSLWSLFRDHPERAYDLTWVAAVEEHILGESLAMVGHLNGIERISRAFVRLHDRAAATGMIEEGSMPLPYKQQDLADALGLSLVHTNKTLAKLRTEGIVTWSGGRLTIHDYNRICDIAGLDPGETPVRRPLI
ncbi:Crp/Fnr family transcriptional regulator [Roseovarius sp. SCSIO 43702]|uniref:Crp/Fnr family transcriptional regulator n=1 Tax=Roseovarius sp. SCSIO 43702 TaxID=2823043 RepID=UPI001C736DE5|nr:Crp/Fnr family transcriptional regulator [Roseovarius sp. SCSIO 43702]QYX57794.1 Crp/Fnr family transcriptional regulator [Roseovarius sp. SCSIO 43702]